MARKGLLSRGLWVQAPPRPPSRPVSCLFQKGLAELNGLIRIAGKLPATRMSVRFRLMTVDDVREAMQLKDAAGWNQTSADWARFLSVNPEGVLLRSARAA